MSFLDNLENNLKALESLEQGGLDQSKRREAERARSIAIAPWAERLKTGEYVQKLMQQSSRAGFARRMKVHIIWIGTTLRLEARGHRLEFRPEPDGVIGVFLHGDNVLREQPVDLNGAPEAILNPWMEILDEQKRIDDARPSEEIPED